MCLPAGGANGNGQSAKLCNNLVLAVSMAAVSEGLALGKRLGLVRRCSPPVLHRSAAAVAAAADRLPEALIGPVHVPAPSPIHQSNPILAKP